MKRSENYEKFYAMLATRSVEEAANLEKIEREAIANFKGQLDELESALGVLRIGHHFGWRLLYLIHNKRTIRKYENLLDIKFKEFFPEEGPSIERSLGYKVVKKIGNFWKAVSGDIKVENKRQID
ncbi:MAG: hypothetical protein RPU64_07810 [Candidatus Sedimenticola sp. (ex Thyasira tokunagai)]